MNRWAIKCLLAGGALFFAACSDVETEPVEVENQGMDESRSGAMQMESESTQQRVERAVAELEAKSDSQLSGEAFFVSKEAGQVNFGIQIEGLQPGTYAVHIHENGDCSAPDASSAGDHWNPTSEDHGKWGEEPFHLGDIGNVEVGEDGDGSLSLTTDLWSMDEQGERSILGKAVVVHSGADDFTTQPDGAAGDRIGCGVIEPKSAT